MAARKPPPSLIQRTPVAEWVAAGAGLLLTLSVIGYTLWEGLTTDERPPELSVVAETAVRAGDSFVLPIIVRNASAETAADVEVTGVASTPGQAPEERRASFAYVPGGGEVRGGLVFKADPGSGQLELSVQGFADP